MTDELELSGSVGVIDAKYDDYDYGAGNFEGKHIENAPSDTARIGLAYRDSKGYTAVWMYALWVMYAFTTKPAIRFPGRTHIRWLI